MSQEKNCLLVKKKKKKVYFAKLHYAVTDSQNNLHRKIGNELNCGCSLLPGNIAINHKLQLEQTFFIMLFFKLYVSVYFHIAVNFYPKRLMKK